MSNLPRHISEHFLAARLDLETDEWSREATLSDITSIFAECVRAGYEDDGRNLMHAFVRLHANRYLMHQHVNRYNGDIARYIKEVLTMLDAAERALLR